MSPLKDRCSNHPQPYRGMVHEGLHHDDENQIQQGNSSSSCSPSKTNAAVSVRTSTEDSNTISSKETRSHDMSSSGKSTGLEEANDLPTPSQDDDKYYSEFDVITLKGGQAQTTTHPGNLFFNKLCEDKHDEFKSASESRKDAIAVEISTAISKRGGNFYDFRGNKMNDSKIKRKIYERFRTISKPKVVAHPTAGENDVVFCPGGQTHLYPANAKYRALLDTFAKEYFPYLFDKSIQEESIDQDDLSKKQLAVRNKAIKIIEDRGGVFRDGKSMRVLANKTVHGKIHDRMKIIKKSILTNKFVLPKDQESRVEDYTLKRTGCTSVKSTITVSEKNQLIQKKLHEELSSTAIGQAQIKKKKQKQVFESDGSDDSDSQSFDSKCLNDDDSDEDDSDGEVEGELAIDAISNSMQASNLTRNDRLKRRNDLKSLPPDEFKRIMQQAKPKKSKRVKKEDRNEDSDKEERELSEYEKLREKKVNRNTEKLRALGLLKSTTDK